ncbi:Hypothetical protein ETEE_2291 [Edwardsiella anguillarum ET080813]|uniref:Uncharacterized protein n=1 Tax=Edwardsiella anguillarum ET080813 TaxID=667120 RepID=A0A076LT17_9GAMM|nr:Hypothetical protein ETEE_2291 [Edwardsiella anguillarum ET080813]
MRNDCANTRENEHLRIVDERNYQEKVCVNGSNRFDAQRHQHTNKLVMDVSSFS